MPQTINYLTVGSTILTVIYQGTITINVLLLERMLDKSESYPKLPLHYVKGSNYMYHTSIDTNEMTVTFVKQEKSQNRVEPTY